MLQLESVGNGIYDEMTSNYHHKMETKELELAAKIFHDDRGKLTKLLEQGERYLLAPETLEFLAAVGTISLVFLMPGLARGLSGVQRSHQKHAFLQRVERLRKRKLIKIYQKGEQTMVEITKEGVAHALKFKVKEMQIKRPPIWDKKWRMVIFDITDDKRRLRDCFRKKLQELNFYPLNESVYVHAFSCFDEVEFIRQIYFVGGEVKYLLVEKIEDDTDLRHHFELS